MLVLLMTSKLETALENSLLRRHMYKFYTAVTSDFYKRTAKGFGVDAKALTLEVHGPIFHIN